MFLCLLPAGALVRYVKLNLAIVHHISSACNSSLPMNEILKFGLSSSTCKV